MNWHNLALVSVCRLDAVVQLGSFAADYGGLVLSAGAPGRRFSARASSAASLVRLGSRLDAANLAAD